MKHLFKYFLCAAVALALAGAFALPAVPAMATDATPVPNFPINPNLPGFDLSEVEEEGPVGLVSTFYTFAFSIAGFLAFIMIVYGGVRYTFSGGSHSAQSDAKDAIKQALLGLALLFGAYLILRTINPDLTTLQFPTLDAYKPTPVRQPTVPSGGVGGGACTSCSCQQYLQNHGSILTTCQPVAAVLAIQQCVSLKTGASPSATTNGAHSANSCHFGGRSCVGFGHAIDYGINGAGGPSRLAEVKAAAEGECATMTASEVSCFYEDPAGNRYPTLTSAVNHIHCNVNAQRDNCGCN